MSNARRRPASPPFHLMGCDALMARMGALAEKDALPGALAEVLENTGPSPKTGPWCRKWTSSMLEIAGRASGCWRKRRQPGRRSRPFPVTPPGRGGRGAVEESAELLADEDRYGVHLDRIAAARAQLGEPLGGLGRALEFDGNAASLQSDGGCGNGGEGDRSLEDFAARIAALAREAPREMPPDLSGPRTRLPSGSGKQKSGGGRKTSGDLRSRRRGTRNRPSKRWLGRERSSSTAAAAVEPVANRETGRPCGAGPKRQWPRRGRWRRTRRWARMPARRWRHRRRSSRAASRSTFEASEVHRDWQEYFVPSGAGHIHHFHAPGSEALADRTAALEKRVAHPLEMPALLRMGSATTGRGRRNGAGSESAGTTWPASPRGRSRARRSGCGTRRGCGASGGRSWTTG